jgi:hypothetical protein
VAVRQAQGEAAAELEIRARLDNPSSVRRFGPTREATAQQPAAAPGPPAKAEPSVEDWRKLPYDELMRRTGMSLQEVAKRQVQAKLGMSMEEANRRAGEALMLRLEAEELEAEAGLMRSEP